MLIFQTGETIPMPVPSSYNDITEDKTLREHVGVVWYERTFFVPQSWKDERQRVWIRFGSVHYLAHVVILFSVISGSIMQRRFFYIFSSLHISMMNVLFKVLWGQSFWYFNPNLSLEIRRAKPKHIFLVQDQNYIFFIIFILFLKYLILKCT